MPPSDTELRIPGAFIFDSPPSLSPDSVHSSNSINKSKPCISANTKRKRTADDQCEFSALVDGSNPWLHRRNPSSLRKTSANTSLPPQSEPLPIRTTAQASSPSATDDSEPSRWTVFYALEAVVGRVWDFCRAGAFRGFSAGGGVGYDWETLQPTTKVEDYSGQNSGICGKRCAVEPRDANGITKKQAPIMHDSSPRRPMTPTPHRARRSGVAATATPQRHRPSTPNSYVSRETVLASPKRSSHADGTRIAPREPASFASPRSSVSKTCRISCHEDNGSKRSNGSPTKSRILRPPNTDRAALGLVTDSSPSTGEMLRGRSNTPVRSGKRGGAADTPPHHFLSRGQLSASPGHRVSQAGNPPKADIAEQFDADSEADIQMEEFNARLTAMIREGREALGTTFEVDMDSDFDLDG